MALRTGNRSTRAGAHRAPRAGPPVRGSVRAKRDGDGKAGVFGVGLRSKSALWRAFAAVVLAGIVGAGLATGGGSSAEPTVYQFLLDWEEGNYQQAAALTTGHPAAVATELASAYNQLDASGLVLSMNHITQHGKTATALFDASVDLGNSGLEWKYRGQFTLRENDAGWQVVWSPSVIAPDLHGNERLAVVQNPYQRAPILDASGRPLAVDSLTYEVGVVVPRARKLGAAEADVIADRLAVIFHMQVQADQMAGEIGALPTGFQELIRLTPSQYAKVAKRLAGIPGVQVHKVSLGLFNSVAPDVVGTVGTEVAPLLRKEGVPYRPGTTVGLSGLQQTYQRQLVGIPTIGVVIENAAGEPTQYVKGATWYGVKGKPVVTTLRYSMQAAANSALAQVPGSAAIVAVQASTGKILAVASKRATGMPALSPLNGQYQPGQAFTVISSAALLASGQVTPASQSQCWTHVQVDGRNFVNAPAEPASMIAKSTVTKDFSLGCSTAFAAMSQSLTASELINAAREFGIGAPWQLPLCLQCYFSGTIGQPGGESKLAADAIGQGNVRVSPLSMALAAATADAGRWHAPSLVSSTSTADPAATAKQTMSTQVVSQLQGLMHNAVTHGSASAANVGVNVYGQAGNAAFGSRNRLRISWFVGFQGNVAFAVAELVPSPSNASASLAGNFLRNIRPGS